ncbi:MAG: PAS domain-containing protein [Ignavibacteriales bacterium]|nr:PAS domain-containing protein [Ignavibacteriales bacterium]
MKKKTSPNRSAVKKNKSTRERNSSNNSFYVVGIGASAGGLEALERFFQHMTENSGMAFIVVSHLDPNHVSIMPELLQKSTRMKLFQAEDGMTVEPNHVYVAPANRDLAILHGTIQLIEPLEAHGFRLPIDFFFKSLSADCGDKAICIILSGMASDGTAGLKAVKGELGMVMVQDPKSARFDGMPSSAVKTGLADYILPPEEMPDQLMRYTSQTVKGALLHRETADGKIPDAFQKIFILLRTHTGHDFSRYKQNTIFRRIERRMNVSLLDTLPNYVRLLQEHPAEIENLFKELLIGVTAFFRDPESFEKLKKILLEVVQSKPDGGQIRMWVPGCYTGEEAYSVAIVLRECMNEARKNLNVQIFATDIDNNAIERARIGTFSGIASDVSKERLDRFFSSEGNLFHIRKEIREMLVFAPQSIIKDPPFTKLDLISCRNLLIYLNAELQKQIIPLLHYSLLPHGILFLGSSETIGEFVDLFSVADKKWKLYKRRDSIYSVRPYMEFPVSRSEGKAHGTIMKTNEIQNITQLAEQVILQNYSPNCVITTANGDIVYIHGRTGKYLELTHGEAKMNIIEMARDGLQQELPVLMRKVLSGKKSLTAEGIKVKTNGSTQVINLTVKPIKEPKEMLGSLLVIFEEALPSKLLSASKRIHYDKKSGKHIEGLERELRSTKENLRSTIEELETSNEELKSTNEEMQSTNEEMQSSNEELETSKEELQSLNEELITVNTELQNKNDELSGINNDMKNLMESIGMPTIFLDAKLRVKKFTFHATKIVNLIASDIGRPITDIATNLKYGKLIEDAKEVLRTLECKEIELQTNDGLWYQMRILPYRTTSNVIDGVVVTFSDISNAKAAYEKINRLNQGIQHAREYADNIVATVRESLLVLDKDLRVVSANRSFYRTFNTASETTVGKSIFELDNAKWEIPQLRELLEEILPRQNVFEDVEIDYNFVNGGRKKLLVNARQMFHGKKRTKLILLAIQCPSIP